MTEFVRAYVPEEELNLVREDLLSKGCSPEYIERAIVSSMSGEVWINDIYQVNKTLLEIPEWHDMYHLSIKRRDRQIIRDWRQFQLIKNELVGEENEGLEKFPAESQKVDTANQYHMWVFADPTVRMQFGFTERLVLEGSLGKSVQRKFQEDL